MELRENGKTQFIHMLSVLVMLLAPLFFFSQEAMAESQSLIDITKIVTLESEPIRSDTDKSVIKVFANMLPEGYTLFHTPSIHNQGSTIDGYIFQNQKDKSFLVFALAAPNKGFDISNQASLEKLLLQQVELNVEPLGVKIPASEVSKDIVVKNLNKSSYLSYTYTSKSKGLLDVRVAPKYEAVLMLSYVKSINGSTTESEKVLNHVIKQLK